MNMGIKADNQYTKCRRRRGSSSRYSGVGTGIEPGGFVTFAPWQESCLRQRHRREWAQSKHNGLAPDGQDTCRSGGQHNKRHRPFRDANETIWAVALVI
jgi:hypothetical protein